MVALTKAVNIQWLLMIGNLDKASYSYKEMKITILIMDEGLNNKYTAPTASIKYCNLSSYNLKWAR
ncbi:hypothetical protein BH23BAC1_BH23BAC1_12520 [soil metagenome]